MIQAVYAQNALICTAINKEKAFRLLTDEMEYKERTPRKEWVLNCHTIGQYDWADGFVRVYPTVGKIKKMTRGRYM
jgi:hypothetical protein